MISRIAFMPINLDWFDDISKLLFLLLIMHIFSNLWSSLIQTNNSWLWPESYLILEEIFKLFKWYGLIRGCIYSSYER
jgi:hypothetical protein